MNSPVTVHMSPLAMYCPLADLAKRVSWSSITMSKYLAPEWAMKKICGIYLSEVFEGGSLKSADQALAATWS